MKEENDILGKALTDFYQAKKNRPKLWIHNYYGDPELMDPAIYFRKSKEMPKIELFALSLCKGKILDVGAGTGAHTLILQKQGHNVTALDISKRACKIMKKRGVKKIINKDLLDMKGGKFDMLLLLMNGIGISGSLLGLRKILRKSEKLLKGGGVVLFDSSDVAYLYTKARLDAEPYYGEVDYQYQYGKLWGPWFKWLYIDQETMRQVSESEGWRFQVLYEDGTGHYLGGLQK